MRGASTQSFNFIGKNRSWNTASDTQCHLADVSVRKAITCDMELTKD